MSQEGKETQIFDASSLMEMQGKKIEEAEAPPEPVVEALDEETTFEPTVKTDIVSALSLTTKLKASSPSMYHILLKAAEDIGAHTVSTPQEITLTPEDKHTFLNSFLDNKTWVAECSAMGGRLRMSFRSRTVAQTSAIHAEVMRRYREGELEPGLSYNTTMLSCFLYFQLVSLNDMRYEQPPSKEEDLFAVNSYNEATSRYEATPPTWYDKARALTKDMPDGKLRVIMNQLTIFETKYWELIMNIDTPDFWNPED